MTPNDTRLMRADLTQILATLRRIESQLRRDVGPYGQHGCPQGTTCPLCGPVQTALRSITAAQDEGFGGYR